LGLLLHAIVHPADIQDRDGGILLLATLFGLHPFLTRLIADAAYQGPHFGSAVSQILPCLEVEIVRRPDHGKGFTVLPKRWIVERTIAWLNRCRRLARIGRTSIAKASPSCASPQSASCSESSAIQSELCGQALRP
jgi:transposase